MQKTIGFIGYECEDILIHLAKLLSYLGRKVTIVDKSKQTTLFGILGVQNTHREAQTQMPEYYLGELRITTGNKEEEFDSDILLYHYGYPSKTAVEGQCESVFMVSDEVLFHAQSLGNIAPINTKTWFLVRNRMELKYDISYLEQVIGIQSDTRLSIPFSEKDWRRRCYLAIDRSYHIRELSAGMRSALADMIISLNLSLTQKEVKKALKKA